jgi:hypothetical protein
MSLSKERLGKAWAVFPNTDLIKPTRDTWETYYMLATKYPKIFGDRSFAEDYARRASVDVLSANGVHTTFTQLFHVQQISVMNYTSEVVCSLYAEHLVDSVKNKSLEVQRQERKRKHLEQTEERITKLKADLDKEMALKSGLEAELA